MRVFDLLRTFSAVSTALVRTSASRGSPTVLILQCMCNTHMTFDLGLAVRSECTSMLSSNKASKCVSVFFLQKGWSALVS